MVEHDKIEDGEEGETKWKMKMRNTKELFKRLWKGGEITENEE